MCALPPQALQALKHVVTTIVVDNDSGRCRMRGLIHRVLYLTRPKSQEHAVLEHF